MSYIDAHVHFWDTAKHRYEWLTDEPGLPRSATLADYRETTAGDEPEGYVVVQADAEPADSVAEVRWVEAMCRADAAFRGMVAWAPVDEGADAVGRHLDELDLASVVGVRRLIQSGPPGLAREPAFIQGVAALGRHDLAFDICVQCDQFDEVIDLAAHAPDTRLVLDHLGKPDIAGGGLDDWRRGIETLARFDHVVCKLSGLITEADWETWTIADLAPYVDVALEAFGPDRMLWGSDWPVAQNAGTHDRWRAATAELLSALTDDERDMIRRGTADAVYRRRGGTTT